MFSFTPRPEYPDGSTRKAPVHNIARLHGNARLRAFEDKNVSVYTNALQNAGGGLIDSDGVTPYGEVRNRARNFPQVMKWARNGHPRSCERRVRFRVAGQQCEHQPAQPDTLRQKRQAPRSCWHRYSASSEIWNVQIASNIRPSP